MSVRLDENLDEQRDFARLPLSARRGLEGVIEASWAMDAACASVDPELWFPEKAGPTARSVLEICAACPVRKSCLASAMVGVEAGIWGGVHYQARSQARGQIARGTDPLVVLDELLDASAAIWARGSAA
jgi:hypothetical protein